MARHQLDVRGKKCPTPTLTMSNLLMQNKFAPGDTLVVTADCPTFEADVRTWCQNRKKVLVLFKNEGGVRTAEVRL